MSIIISLRKDTPWKDSKETYIAPIICFRPNTYRKNIVSSFCAFFTWYVHEVPGHKILCAPHNTVLIGESKLLGYFHCVSSLKVLTNDVGN